MMGEHKTNPVTIAAKNGTIPPKKKSKLSKRKREALLRKRIQDATGLPRLVESIGENYYLYL